MKTLINEVPICQLGPTDAVSRGVKRRPVRFEVVVQDVTEMETHMALGVAGRANRDSQP
jgi:hypothetical protein